MDGLLIIDKPAGLTSHDVVARVRRILKTKRVGHTGTLDPFATGVMVILVGKATRLAQFLDKDEKEYEAEVRFGFETDTGDRTGSAKSKVQSLKSVSHTDVECVLHEFLGVIEQTPPMYSAKKVQGKKLYELARKGIEIERKPVNVMIYELEIIRGLEFNTMRNPDFGLWTLDFGLKVVCSAGTYIRTLAEDIGRKVGTGAHLAELRRTRAGKFDLLHSVSLEKLEELNDPEKCLIPMNAAVEHLPKIILSEVRAEKTKNGLSTRFDDGELEDGQAVQMIDEYENLIAIGFYNVAEKGVQPKVVLS
ncbi:MAG: tRNA pseudouridine(55) synthase TruB [Pyrinomonadaceae bacterium]